MNVKQLAERFFITGSYKTASTHPAGTSLNNAAKNVTFFSLQNFQFVFARSLVHNLMTSLLVTRFLIFDRSFEGGKKLDRSNSLWFLCEKKFQTVLF